MEHHLNESFQRRLLHQKMPNKLKNWYFVLAKFTMIFEISVMKIICQVISPSQELNSFHRSRSIWFEKNVLNIQMHLYSGSKKNIKITVIGIMSSLVLKQQPVTIEELHMAVVKS